MTESSTFRESAEARQERLSRVLVMPQYREPILLRCVEVVRDALSDLDETGRSQWNERVHYRCDDGAVRTLAELWGRGEPGVVRHFVEQVRWISHPGVRTAVRMALGRTEVATS